MKFLFFPLILVILTSCELDTKKTGLHKCSKSIEDSKSNGVFLKEIEVENPIIKLGNYKTDTIKQMWVERMWSYEREDGKTIIKQDSSEQILILFGSLSREPNDTILLKQGASYFGWNGVFVSSYPIESQIFIVKKVNGTETIIDTLRLKK